jgi:hypothetical protein
MSGRVGAMVEAAADQHGSTLQVRVATRKPAGRWADTTGFHGPNGSDRKNNVIAHARQ